MRVFTGVGHPVLALLLPKMASKIRRKRRFLENGGFLSQSAGRMDTGLGLLSLLFPKCWHFYFAGRTQGFDFDLQAGFGNGWSFHGDNFQVISNK
ncbi:hypothetical protein LP417_33755 (plasmid) [Polaromonas sp. P1-6]|nr:hypothetical protein LP417_33755 [Polaromonas sp. P1-6]